MIIPNKTIFWRKKVIVAIKFTPTAPKKKSIGQRDPPPCVFPSPRRLISGPDTEIHLKEI